MSHFGWKAAISAVAFATVGSTVFGGVALAVDKKDGHVKKDVEVTKTGGVGGSAGNPTYNCALVDVVPASTGDVAGYNPSVLLACTATAGGGYGSAVAVN